MNSVAWLAESVLVTANLIALALQNPLPSATSSTSPKSLSSLPSLICYLAIITWNFSPYYWKGSSAGSSYCCYLNCWSPFPLTIIITTTANPADRHLLIADL